MSWAQSNGEPSYLFIFFVIILFPVWMWAGEQLLKGLVRRWKQRR